jgi:hypothetical protein
MTRAGSEDEPGGGLRGPRTDVPDEPDSDAPYVRPRIAAGLGILSVIAFLYVVNRPPDAIQLGLMLGTALLFLGVEAGKALLR